VSVELNVLPSGRKLRANYLQFQLLPETEFFASIHTFPVAGRPLIFRLDAVGRRTV
jgi:hypothetical protein